MRYSGEGDEITGEEFALVLVETNLAQAMEAAERIRAAVEKHVFKFEDQTFKLTISLGGDATRTVFAGIKGFHEPAALVGRLVVVVANLAPRQMKFGLSEGMVVAASGAGAPGVYLLAPDSGALPGMRLH